MFPAFRISRRLAVLITGLLLSATVQAHVVKQIYARFTAGTDAWRADVILDAGYVWPEFRDDPNSPQPSLEWLESRPPSDFAVLRRESESLLRQHLEFRSGAAAMTWTCRFPDFDSFPPDFPEQLGGGAFLTVRIEGPLPPPGSSLTVKELTGELPDFVFQTGEDEFPVLEPGKTAALFQTPSPPKNPSLVQSFWQGFTGMLPAGWDCALFVVALILPDRRLRPAGLQFLCYAAGSSLTFWLVRCGVVYFSSTVVLPVAALSVAMVAADNLWNSRARTRRLLIIFGLSLVQGLAFGETLTGTIPGKDLSPVLAVNVGIESAAAVVLLAALLLFRLLPRESLRNRTAHELNLVIILTGLALCIQRVLY